MLQKTRDLGLFALLCILLAIAAQAYAWLATWWLDKTLTGAYKLFRLVKKTETT